jgi:hypothetical protein
MAAASNEHDYSSLKFSVSIKLNADPGGRAV